MATIKKNERVVEMVETVITEESFDLNVSRAEMEALKSLLGHGTSGGTPDSLGLSSLWNKLYRDNSIGYMDVSFKTLAALSH